MRCEELMAQVDRNAIVPVFEGYFGRLVPIVVRGVVDEDGDGTRVVADALDDGLQRRDVTQVAGDEGRRTHPGVADARAKRRRRRLVDVDESDPRMLRAKVLDD